MKLATIVGARPQFIKASAISRSLAQESSIQEILIHTGQHHDANMSDIFFEELQIPKPHYNLNIHGGTHGQMTGRMMEALEEVLLKEKPDMVLIYGDTNSTLAGAVVASKLHIPLAHVEAGLRSFNKKMPEEINRIVADRLSDLLFAPTSEAVENLKNEGCSDDRILRTGDVMLDTALYFSKKISEDKSLLKTLEISEKAYALVTLHRAENTDSHEALQKLLSCLEYAKNFVDLVIPLHPRTKKAFEQHGLFEALLKLGRVINPLGYLEMVQLELNAKIILTDSGGVQKEAYFYQVPCITMRNETEWVELVRGGWNKLTGLDIEKFKPALTAFLESPLPAFSQNLYGDGSSAKTIVQAISEFKVGP